MITPESPIGLASAMSRGTSEADVISSVEQVAGGDLLVSVGSVFIGRSGDLGRLHEQAVIRLTAADRDRLIEALTWARTSDLERT